MISHIGSFIGSITEFLESDDDSPAPFQVRDSDKGFSDESEAPSDGIRNVNEEVSGLYAEYGSLPGKIRVESLRLSIPERKTGSVMKLAPDFFHR